MKHTSYDLDRAHEILPLLSSIGREIEERSLRLEKVESRIEQLNSVPSSNDEELRSLVAEAACHRREIRLARAELEHMGCSVLGTTPLTIRIPARVGSAKKSFVWRTGDPVLR